MLVNRDLTSVFSWVSGEMYIFSCLFSSFASWPATSRHRFLLFQAGRVHFIMPNVHTCVHWSLTIYNSHFMCVSVVYNSLKVKMKDAPRQSDYDSQQSFVRNRMTAINSGAISHKTGMLCFLVRLLHAGTYNNYMHLSPKQFQPQMSRTALVFLVYR